MISAAQKKAKDNFKKAIAYRKKTGCDLKAAFAHVYGKKVGAVKKKAVKKAAPKKKAAKKVAKKKLTSIDYDKRYQALKPGKRTAYDSGNTYYEYRKNRSDKGKLLGIKKNINSQYISLSGYNFGKEIVVGRISNLSTLKNLVPEVKLRVTRGKKTINDIITSSEVASQIFKRFIGTNKIDTQELFAVAYTNQANKILGVYVHSIGAINAVNVDVRLVLAGALQMGATGMLLCHNHPSGNLKASTADERITEQLKEAAKFHNIQILDHIIITKKGFYSFADNGLL